MPTAGKESVELIGWGKNLLLTFAAACLTLLLCETALRLRHGVSPFDFSSVRNRGSGWLDVRDTVRRDPGLGWSLKDGLDQPGLHTLEHGIRRNSAEQT